MRRSSNAEQESSQHLYSRMLTHIYRTIRAVTRRGECEAGVLPLRVQWWTTGKTGVPSIPPPPRFFSDRSPQARRFNDPHLSALWVALRGSADVFDVFDVLGGVYCLQEETSQSFRSKP